MQPGQILPAKPIDELYYLILPYHLAVDADALAEVDKMGGSEQPRAIACSLKNRSDRVSRRAFSVCPGHVDAFQTTLRITKGGCKRFNRVKTWFICRRPYLLKQRSLAVKEINSLLICRHNSIIYYKSGKPGNEYYDYRVDFGEQHSGERGRGDDYGNDYVLVDISEILAVHQQKGRRCD